MSQLQRPPIVAGMRIRHSLNLGAIAAIVLLIPFLPGCDSKETQAPVAPPTSLSVSRPVQQQVGDFVEFTGTIGALNTVDLRARVKGFLKKVNFVEGSMV